MKKILLLLLLATAGLQAQTLQSPTYNATTTNTLKIKTPATVGTVNFIPAYDTDEQTLSKIAPINVNIPYTPINYTISGQTIGQQIAAIDAKIGTMGTTSAGVTQRVYFTADNTTVNSVIYFASSLSGKGSTASGSPPALVLADNTKAFFTKDVISIAQPSPTIGYAGTYSGNLTVSASPTPVATQQRFTVEIYRTDNLGVPIASGVSGSPVGDLGVTVLAILDSGIINLTAGSITNIAVSGVLTQNITLNTGERLRYHVSAAKIGTGGGSVTFGVYYGTSYNSYYDVPVAIRTNGVLDDSDVPGAVTATDALNYLYNSTDFPVTAYVQTTGNNATAQLGNNKRPFLTIDAALDALPSTGGVVRIGIGSFSSPTPSKIKSNTTFVGSKEPTINSTVTISSPNVRPVISAPTALVNGTILTGEFSSLDKNNIIVSNLGIDVGKTWVDTFNGGTPVGGLVIASVTTTAPVKNIQVSNVTVLGYSAATSQHCMLFENIIDSKFNNLTTYYHVHGVALKGLNITMDGLNLHSHNNDGLIIKSDTYAPTRDVSVNNVNINSLSGYEGGGIILEEGVNGSSLLERVSLNNINLKYVKFGLNNVNKISSVNISNFNLYDSNTFGIKFDNNVDKINLSGLNIVKTTTDGIDVSITGTELVNISNSSVSDATGIGYKLTTAGNSTINLVNSNTLNTTASYSITGTGVYGSSNFGTGTTTGYISFRNPFVKSLGRIFTIDDTMFGDLASTSGSLDMRFSNSSQTATIESFNFATALKKPLIISSLNFNVSSLGVASGAAGVSSNDFVTKSQLDASKPYKVWVGTFQNNGTSAPTVTVNENTLGGTVVWTRTTTGTYRGTLSGVFNATSGKTNLLFGGGAGITSNGFFNQLLGTSNYVEFTTVISGALSDSVLNGFTWVEIRVYP